MFPDVPRATAPDDEDPDPPEETEEGRQADEQQPEPDEQVDLLVEEVDGKDALGGVSVQVAVHLEHFEVAQCDARESVSKLKLLPLTIATITWNRTIPL